VIAALTARAAAASEDWIALPTGPLAELGGAHA